MVLTAQSDLPCLFQHTLPQRQRSECDGMDMTIFHPFLKSLDQELACRSIYQALMPFQVSFKIRWGDQSRVAAPQDEAIHHRTEFFHQIQRQRRTVIGILMQKTDIRIQTYDLHCRGSSLREQRISIGKHPIHRICAWMLPAVPEVPFRGEKFAEPGKINSCGVTFRPAQGRKGKLPLQPFFDCRNFQNGRGDFRILNRAVLPLEDRVLMFELRTDQAAGQVDRELFVFRGMELSPAQHRMRIRFGKQPAAEIPVTVQKDHIDLPGKERPDGRCGESDVSGKDQLRNSADRRLVKHFRILTGFPFHMDAVVADADFCVLFCDVNGRHGTSLFAVSFGKQVQDQDDEQKVVHRTGNEIGYGDPDQGSHGQERAEGILHEGSDGRVAEGQEQQDEKVVQDPGYQVRHHDPEHAEDGDDGAERLFSVSGIVTVVGKKIVVVGTPLFWTL